MLLLLLLLFGNWILSSNFRPMSDKRRECARSRPELVPPRPPEHGRIASWKLATVGRHEVIGHGVEKKTSNNIGAYSFVKTCFSNNMLVLLIILCWRVNIPKSISCKGLFLLSYQLNLFKCRISMDFSYQNRRLRILRMLRLAPPLAGPAAASASSSNGPWPRRRRGR